MKIGICDDNALWLQKAQTIIYEYSEKRNLDLKIYCFLSPLELENYDGDPFDVLFMDIMFKSEDKKKNGIQTAAWINQKWKQCQIVYLTNFLAYATEIYHTNHIFFVLKEQFENRIGEIFAKIFHILSQMNHKMIFSTVGGKVISLAPSDILYFEREKRITNVITIYGSYKIRYKLSELMEHLPEYDFVRCHNSYIVYLPAVRELQTNEFILNNEKRITISRSYRKSTKDAFMRWASIQIS